MTTNYKPQPTLYEVNAAAAFGYCEAEFWGICNTHRSVKDNDSIYNPKTSKCRKCRLYEAEQAERLEHELELKTRDEQTT